MQRASVIAATVLVAMLLPSAVLGAGEYPEANPMTAFNAGEDQRIWQKPGLLVLEAKQNPISRATITVYDDDETQHAILTLTHIDTETGGAVTFYHNITMMDESEFVLSFNSPNKPPLGMWEEGFLNIIPRERKENLERLAAPLRQMPTAAQALWVLAPGRGHLFKSSENELSLALIFGGIKLNGMITFSIGTVENFAGTQQEQAVTIWGMTNLSLTSIQWRSSERPDRKFVWKPGMGKPVFSDPAES